MLSIVDKGNKYGINNQNRWSTDEEMQMVTKLVTVGETNTAGASGIPIMANSKEMWVEDGDNHTIVFGNSGSMKSRAICIPLIKTLCDASESMIISDVKGELYERTSGYLKSRGYEIQCLNFRDIGTGHIWNPLTGMYEIYRTDKGLASELIADFITMLVKRDRRQDLNNRVDPFWDQMVETLGIANLQLLFQTGHEDEINIKSFTRLCTDYGEGGEDLSKSTLYKIAACLNPDSLTYLKYMNVFSNSDRNKMTIQACTYGMLSLFMTNGELTEFLSHKNEIDVEKSRAKKMAIFIIAPDEKNTYNSLISLFIQECYVKLIRVSQEMQQRGKVPKRMNFILDEFANLATIKDFNAKISASRSRNIRFFMFCQGLMQLKGKYAEEAYNIIGNCNNIIYLNSKEMELLNYLKNLCGEVEYYDGHREYSKPLITTTELQHFSKGRTGVEALMLIGRNKPYISFLPDIDQYQFEEYEPIPLIKRELRDKISVLSSHKIAVRYTVEQIKRLF